MIANYIKIALRNIKKQKGYSFINIAGLSIGMTCAILIMLYVKYELSYDTFHKNSDRIFRVALNLPAWNYRGSTDFCKTTGALAPALMEEFSEVVYASRLNGASGPFRYQENRFVEEGIYADKHFFNVFTYPLSSGNKNTALKEPFSIVLSRELANKYFGDENPIGKVISFRDEYNYKVTGIIESVPENSHIQFDYLLSFSSYEAMGRKGVNRWGTINYCTYALLQNGVQQSQFDAKLPSIVDKYHQVRSEEMRQSYFLQPLTSIHLESHLNFEMSENSDLRYVYIFTSIAFVILMIACINYMNLATARATKRYKEIGIRKAIGAKKLELIKQFLGESLFFAFLAMIISILWIWVVLPYFSTFVDRDILFSENVYLINVLGLFAIVTIVGIISGIYPAFLLSSFKPVNVLKSAGAPGKTNKHHNLRNLLVIFQFCISIILILSAIVIKEQLSFVKYKDVGYTRDNIVVVKLRDEESRSKTDIIKNELLKNPLITAASVSNRTPIRISNVSDAEVESDSGETVTLAQINGCYIDFDFIDLYDIEIVKGRKFSPEFSTDSESSVIVNETAINKLGIKNPIGKKFSRWDVKDGRIIGVVKDFHFATFKLAIEPMMFLIRPERGNLFSIKISSQNIQETLAFINSTFKNHNNSFIFDYNFLDDSFNQLYKAEQRVGAIIITFSMIAIIIASLGLFGLISFISERKTKEIGIRKTLGASVTNIVKLIVGEFMFLILSANIIALPIAYYLMNLWLQDFAYRISINIWMFLTAGIMVFIIAVLTTSYQSIKAAIANPVDSLKYEENVLYLVEIKIGGS